MFSRRSARLCSALRSESLFLPPSASSYSVLPHRHVSRNIRDPFPSVEGSSQTVSLSHPLDPSNTNSSPPLASPSSNSNLDSYSSPSSSSSPSLTSSTSVPPPNNNTAAEPPTASGVPIPYVYPTSSRPSYTNPPFDTYAFFKALERTFPTPTAQSLMRATRALVVDRIGKVRNEALNAKDLDNVTCALVSPRCTA